MRLPSSNACHDLGPLVSVAKMSRKPSFKRPSIDVTKVEDDLVISTPKSDSDTIFFGDEVRMNVIIKVTRLNVSIFIG